MNTFGSDGSAGRFDLRLGSDGARVVRRKTDKSKKHSTRVWYYVGFLGEIGFTLSLPIAGGAIIGVYIDRQFGTYPRGTLGLLVVGIVVSMWTFIRTIQTLLRRKD